jgi:hypothetical protein
MKKFFKIILYPIAIILFVISLIGLLIAVLAASGYKAITGKSLLGDDDESYSFLAPKS